MSVTVAMADSRVFRLLWETLHDMFLFQVGEGESHMWASLKSAEEPAELGFFTMRAPLRVTRDGRSLHRGSSRDLRQGDQLALQHDGKWWTLGTIARMHGV